MQCPECRIEMESGRLFLRSTYAARVFFLKAGKENSPMKKWAGAMFDTKGNNGTEIISTDKDKNNKEAFYCLACRLLLTRQ